MTERRPRRPVVPDRPLTPAEQEAVRRQGAYLAWVRATHPGAGPGMFTRGVCGGEARARTGKGHTASTTAFSEQREATGPAHRATTAQEPPRPRTEREREESERYPARDDKDA